MKKKRLIPILTLFAITLLLSLGSVFASKPMDVESTVTMDCTSLVDSKVAGNTVLSERVFEGSFTDGNFEGDVYREATLISNLKTNSANGPLPAMEAQVSTVNQIFVVTNARVSVDGLVAVGSFELTSNGQVGNVKWHVSSSDMTIEATGEPVKMHGNGIVTVMEVIPPAGPPPPFFTIINGIIGQVSFS